MNAAPCRFAGLQFQPADGRLERIGHDRQRTLRPQVARLLIAFLDRPHTLISRDALIAQVWDEGSVVDFEAGLAAVLRELRAELKQLDAPEDLVETVPRRGYRLNADVERPAGQGAGSPAAGPTGLSPAGRKRLIGYGLSLLVLIAAALIALQQRPEVLPPPEPGRTLAVLPFHQFGQPEQGARQLDLLLADQLLVQLWDHQPEGMILIGRASVSAYPDPAGLAAAVAEDLGIDLLIEGSIAFEADRASVSARLLAMPAGRILWSHHLVFEPDELPPTSQIAAMLAESLLALWPALNPGP